MGEISTAREGAVAIVTITTRDGCMTEETVSELAPVIERLEADTECRGIVFTGGRAGVFIRHYHVGELERMSTALRGKGAHFDEQRPMRRERDIDRMFRRLSEMPKITIAAINGFAMGGGFEFCLACDLRLVQDGEHELGLPEAKIGLLPGAGGTQRMTRLIGEAAALELLLRGGTVPPRQALALRMVNEVTDGPVLPRAIERAQVYAAIPEVAFGHIKRLVRDAATRPLPEALVAERTLFLDCLVSEDANRLMSWSDPRV